MAMTLECDAGDDSVGGGCGVVNGVEADELPKENGLGLDAAAVVHVEGTPKEKVEAGAA